MKIFLGIQGFIGSYQGVGMHGMVNNYFAPPWGTTTQIFKLPEVDLLDRIVVKLNTFDDEDLWQVKAYATGEKKCSIDSKQSYILEFYAQGVGELDSYLYAPLFFNPISGEKETADDVIYIKDKVVFATRDTRSEHAPVNLRISDTNNALLNSYIDTQWQLWLPPTQQVISKLRLLNLQNDSFVLAYIVFDFPSMKYKLCTNRIKFGDLITYNNTIVSHNIEIDGDCINLVDMIYEYDVNTMVILLNGNGKSKLYHLDPYVNISSTFSRLDYPYGELSSIDTVGDYVSLNNDMYVAMGDSVFFSQNISNPYNIGESCLTKTKFIMLEQEHPSITLLTDPINGYSSDKVYAGFFCIGGSFTGTRTCYIISTKDSTSTK